MQLYTNRTMCQFQVLEETVLREKQLWKANSVKAQLALEYLLAK